MSTSETQQGLEAETACIDLFLRNLNYGIVKLNIY